MESRPVDRSASARTAFAVAVSGPLASPLLGGLGLGAAAGVGATLGWRVPVAVLGWLGRPRVGRIAWLADPGQALFAVLNPDPSQG
ncbi:hypothetical protein [Streptomyces umbrinus]|uniref:hypothetical protein n=1 Tax=Streptomyces umbrinus TaxID=67370 RepID=UPI0027D8FFB4|nr:hypothetical protein [Streptomyces umbrinus]